MKNLYAFFAFSFANLLSSQAMDAQLQRFFGTPNPTLYTIVTSVYEEKNAPLVDRPLNYTYNFRSKEIDWKIKASINPSVELSEDEYDNAPKLSAVETLSSIFNDYIYQELIYKLTGKYLRKDENCIRCDTMMSFVRQKFGNSDLISKNTSESQIYLETYRIHVEKIYNLDCKISEYFHSKSAEQLEFKFYYQTFQQKFLLKKKSPLITAGLFSITMTPFKSVIPLSVHLPDGASEITRYLSESLENEIKKDMYGLILLRPQSSIHS